MRFTPLSLGFVILFAACAAAQEIPTNIFDDNWSPPKRESKPAAPPPERTQPTPLPETPAPSTPTPSPDNSRLPPGAIALPALLPIPTPAEHQQARKLIDELYKTDIAKAHTPAQKITLARKLLSVAGDTRNDPPGKYVLLTQARELAIGAGDPVTAFSALDQLGGGYQIDYFTSKLDLFATLANTVHTPADCKTVVTGLNRWADAQVKEDRYDAARKACDIALPVARRASDPGMVKQTSEHATQIAEIAAGWSEVQKSLAALEKNPKDPTANLAAGKFFCFMKGDWKKGLPMLTFGSNSVLQALAEKELRRAPDSDTRMAMGDGWWDTAEHEKGPVQNHIREHAARWYQESLPGSSGIAKEKAEKRIKQLAGGTPAESGTGLEKGSVGRVDGRAESVDLGSISGVWELKRSNGHDATWTFKSNGTVITSGASHGKWTLAGNVIKISWRSGKLESVTISVSGNSISGVNSNGSEMRKTQSSRK